MTTTSSILARHGARENLFRLVAELAAARARLDARPLILDLGRTAPSDPRQALPRQIGDLPHDLWLSLACLVAPVGRGATPVLETLLTRAPEDLPLVLAGDGSGLTVVLARQLGPRTAGVRVRLESHLPRVLHQLDPERDARAVLDGLRRLVALGRENACPVVLETPILSVNADHLDGLVTFAAELGIGTVLLWEDSRLPDALDPRERHGAADLEQLLERACAAAVREGVALVRPGVGAGLGRRAGLPPDLVEILELVGDLVPDRCPDRVTGLAVDGRGTVRAGHAGCGPGPVLGDLGTQAFGQIWNGAAARRLRAPDPDAGPVPACAACPRGPASV